MFELALPWAGLTHGTDFEPTAGARFSMNMAVNDNDGEPHTSNSDQDNHREHIRFWATNNTNRQGEEFGYVVLGEGGGAGAMFSDIPYFGNSENYSYFVNPGEDPPASEEDWTVMDVNDDPALVLTNGNVNPTHPSGNGYFNPGPGFNNGQASAPGARAVAVDTSFTDFEMTVDMKRPEDQASDFYDLAVLFGYVDTVNFHYANFGIHPTQATATIVDIDAGEGLRTPADPRFTNILPVFPKDDDYHSVLLRREGEQVALFIDGAPVMYTSDEDFSTEGSVGVGSWNDNGIFDNIDVVALDGEYMSKMSFIVSSTTGAVTFDSLKNIPSDLNAGAILEALTLSEGATAVVQDGDEEELEDDMMPGAGAVIVVTAEAGNTKAYGLSFGEAMDDNRIEAVFAPVSINEDSTELFTLQGTDVALLLDKVRAPAMATEQVVAADSTVITDMATILTEEMQYQIIGESGAARNYPINLEAPTYPLANIAEADTNVIIDEFFTEWEAIEQQFDIDGTSNNPNLSDTMPTANDISGYFKTAWDDTYLYLYFNITDDELNTTAEQAFQNDGIEIALLMSSSIEGRSAYNLFFNEANQPGNQKFVYTYNADWSTTFNNSALDPFNKSATLFDGAVIATFPKDDGTGYEVEMQIPWSGLNQNDTEVSEEAVTPALGEQFSINVAINDNDGTGRESVKYWAHPQMNRDGNEFGIFTIGETTSTRNKLASFDLDVFPNPVSDQLEIRTDKQIERVTVVSVTGQVLLDGNQPSVDVSALRTGTYLLRIRTTDDLVRVARFIKQ
jgi:hypothetical protein